MKIRCLPGIIVTFIFLGCTTVNDASHGNDKSVKFNELKSYAWKPLPETRWLDDMSIEQIKRSVDKNLDSKGLELSPTKADFDVELVFRPKAQKSRGGSRRPREVDLSINFLAPDTSALIWQGMDTLKMDRRFGKYERSEVIEKTVSKIMGKFTPSMPDNDNSQMEGS